MIEQLTSTRTYRHDVTMKTGLSGSFESVIGAQDSASGGRTAAGAGRRRALPGVHTPRFVVIIPDGYDPDGLHRADQCRIDSGRTLGTALDGRFRLTADTAHRGSD